MSRWDSLTVEKKMVAISFLFVFMTFATAGTFFEQSTTVAAYDDVRPYDSQLPTEYTATGEESSDRSLKAIVKGSIYKTGENMTVYGACFSGDGYLLPEANATFTAWYPNGSIVTGPLAAMDAITDDFNGYSPNGTGRHKIHVTMSSTSGTYLTEMRCELDGEWAVAFGEWQNPEWVQDIANTYENVTNIYQLLQDVAVNLSQFQSDTGDNFTSVLNAITESGGNVDDLAVQLREFESQVSDIDVNRWLLDTSNPFYVLGSGTHNWRAVDMLHVDAVAAVSSDGYFAIWDGETWSEVNVAGVEFRDVSILPANVVYAWAVGGDGVNPVLSINGANETTLNLTGGSPTVANAVKLFVDPNNPSGNFYVYVVGNDGSAYISVDAGASYSLIGSLDSGNVGEISQVVENYDVYGQVDGYMTILGQGSSVATYDGVTWSNYSVAGIVRGVDLLYYDLGYVVVEDILNTKIYKFNGSDFVLEYTIEDASIIPSGVQIHSQNDVWVTTRDPSVFYHFDGRSWEYSTLAYSDFASVIISFNGNGSNVSGTGLYDVSMPDSRHGYAVGDDGLILIYQGQTADMFADLLVNLTAQLDGVEVNLTPVLDVLSAMNVTLESVSADTINIIADLYAMNVTVEDISSVVDLINFNLNGFIDMSTGNFSLINSKLDELNFTNQEQTVILNAINATMVQSFIDLNSSNQLEFFNINTVLTNMNTTLVNTNDLVVALNVTTTQGFQDLTVLIDALNVTIDGRFNTVDQNLSAIYDAILALNFSMSSQFDDLNISMQLAFSDLSTELNILIGDLNDSMNVRFDSVDGNLSVISTQITDMNASIQSELNNIDNFLFSMNATIDYKLDNILSNVTYTNLYLTTTLFPLANDTFTSVTNILILLGIMDAKLDVIGNVTNATFDIVNESATDIDYLVNQSDRIRAWVTQ